MRRSTLRLAVAAGFLVLSAAPSRAAEYTWTGGGTTPAWSEAANWGGTVPASNLSTTQIRLAGTTNTATILDAAMPTSGSPAAFELHRLTFAAGGGPFTISWGAASGPPLRISGTVSGSNGGIVIESGNASNHRINVPVTISGGGSHTWAHDGTGLLTVSGPVTLAGPGVSIFGSGDYAITGAITGPSNGINFSGAGTKTLSGANTYGGVTNIVTGTVKLAGGMNRLPTGTTVQLGAGGAIGTGTLDLNGQSQTVIGLTAINGEANNRVVSTAAGAVPTLTVNRPAGDQTFNGTLGGPGGNAFGLRVVTGSNTEFTLTQANTYTGDTTISGTLMFSGSGSIANSRTITVGPTSPGGSLLDASALTGGDNFGTSTSRFALAAGQTIQGFGRGVSGGLAVRPLSVVRGGVGNEIGTLTVTGGDTTVHGAATTVGGTIRTLVRDNAGTVANSKLSLGANALNFEGVGPGKFVLDLRDAGGLQFGTSYTIELATATGGIRRNGVTVGSGSPYTFSPADYQLTSPDFLVQNANLVADGGSLRLTFTPVPVPEPAALLGVAAAGLAAARLARRRVSPGTT